MKIGILVGRTPGDSTAPSEVLGSPAPYREALAIYREAISDPEVCGKYAALELWTRAGIAKKRKLSGVAAPVVEEAAPAPRKKVTKKAAPKKAAPTEEK